MLASISRGATVITAGGFFGVVRDVLDDSYIIELDEGVKARILKSSISMKKTEGSSETKAKKKKLKKNAETPDEALESAQEIAAEPETAAETPAVNAEADAAPVAVETEEKKEA